MACWAGSGSPTAAWPVLAAPNRPALHRRAEVGAEAALLDRLGIVLPNECAWANTRRRRCALGLTPLPHRSVDFSTKALICLSRTVDSAQVGLS